MKSKGKNQGFKCRNCKNESDKPIIQEKERFISTGFYEVPVCARRHISKPLKRMKTSQFYGNNKKYDINSNQQL